MCKGTEEISLPPVAAFSGNPISGEAPLTVNFTDQSTNDPTSHGWDFGDGTTSTQQNPAKTYTTAGNYTVKLTATNSAGSDTHIKNNYIDVTTGGGGTTGQPCPGTPTVTDIDGNVYNIVLIGNQCWMKENLKTTRDAAGNNITRYCYENKPNYCNLYGGLYSWSVLMDGAASSNNNPSGVQGICPSGWHVPSDSEWCDLAQNVDLTVDCDEAWWTGTNTGLKMKATINWSSGGNGTNESGFTVLASGLLNTIGNFNSIGKYTYFWSSTVSEPGKVWSWALGYDSNGIHRYSNLQPHGYSVRCQKD